MLRRRLLIAQVCLVAVLAVLAFPGSGSALSAYFITLTAGGAAPAAASLPAGMYPVWVNHDTTTHTVAFPGGLCSFQVAPGAIGQCTGAGFSVGVHPYTVDGTAQASITVTPGGRTVSLTARRHAIRRGARLTLHGLLNLAQTSPPVLPGARTSMRVTLLARYNSRHPFRAVATMRVARLTANGFPWRRHIRPRRTTTYIVEANSQPAAGQAWQNAHSGPFTVRVRPRAHRAR